jgi:hypothetical protein
MPKISSYNTVTPQGSDKIIISQENGTPTDVTKNITVDGLKQYIIGSTPTPVVYVLKDTKFTTPSLETQKICIQKPIETEWLTKNPRLFLFRYKKAKTGYSSVVLKRKGFIHPSHQNGSYIQTNFPGSNWGSSALYTDQSQLLPPLVTQWDINTELKIAKTGTLITDFASLRSSTYIEIPFSKLQFLYNVSSPSTPYTSFPVTGAGTICAIRGMNKFNTLTPWGSLFYKKIILKFAIGIPNPTWTNTNHELPYLMGELSNPLQMVYQVNASNTSEIKKVVISQGSNATVSRSAQ